MPRAIEIYVDEKEKAVLINTNYGNREVRGASWVPQKFRLGWDSPFELSNAFRQFATAHINILSLRNEQNELIAVAWCSMVAK